MWRTVLLLSSLVLLGSAKVPIGVNLPFFDDDVTNSQRPFIDIFKYGSNFIIERSWDNGINWGYYAGSFDARQDGFPISLNQTSPLLAATTLLGTPATSNAIYPTGIYVCKYQGNVLLKTQIF